MKTAFCAFRSLEGSGLSVSREKTLPSLSLKADLFGIYGIHRNPCQGLCTETHTGDLSQCSPPRSGKRWGVTLKPLLFLALWQLPSLGRMVLSQPPPTQPAPSWLQTVKNQAEPGRFLRVAGSRDLFGAGGHRAGFASAGVHCARVLAPRTDSPEGVHEATSRLLGHAGDPTALAPPWKCPQL